MTFKGLFQPKLSCDFVAVGHGNVQGNNENEEATHLLSAGLNLPPGCLCQCCEMNMVGKHCCGVANTEIFSVGFS